MKCPCNLKLPTEITVPGAANTNIDGIPKNIYEENSAHNFRVPSERNGL